MEKIKKGLLISRIVLYSLAIVFVILQLVWVVSIYIACGLLVIALANLAIVQMLVYHTLNRQIENDYEIHLVELYNEGKITKEQLDEGDKSRFKEYKKLYRGEKAKIMLIFVLWIGVATLLLSILLKQLF